MARQANQVLWDQWRQRTERQGASGLSIVAFWFAAAFHLRWLCKQDPKNVDLQNRLRHAEAGWAKTSEKIK